MDDTSRKLKVVVISPTEVGFEGTGDSIVVPAHDGLMGILYGHAPLMTLLGSGDVTVTDGSTVHRIAVSGGLVWFSISNPGVSVSGGYNTEILILNGFIS